MLVPTPRLAVLVLSSLLLTSLAAHADNWPRFRGPNGTGIANDKNIPVKWTDDNILWKSKLPGTGHSSPIVWGDRLFVQTATVKERSLLCVDVKDGRIVWSRSAPGETMKGINKLNSYASMTPVTDGERVYALFWDGKEYTLHGYDFQGNQLWTRNLGKYTSQHGAGHSPMVVGDKVILNNDQDGYAKLLAVDGRTGNIAWEQERPAFRACYSVPFMLEKPGQAPEMIVVSTKGITGYDPETGSKKWNFVWKFEGKPQRTTSSPVLAHDTILACAGDGSGDRHMVAVRLDKAGPKLAWENRKEFPYVPTPLTRGDHAYFVNDKGMAGCYSIKDGGKVWYERLPSATFMASPVLVNGKMYAPSEQGDVWVIEAEPKYSEPVRNTLGELIRATPAVSNGRMYIRGEHHLFCIGKK